MPIYFDKKICWRSQIKNEEVGEKLEKMIREKLRNHDKKLNFLILLNPASGTGQSLRKRFYVQ